MHLIGVGCPKCGIEKTVDGNRRTQSDFLEKAKTVHGSKFDYTKTVYQHSEEKIIIICRKHGEFNQTPHSHLRGQGCPVCKESRGEIAIARILDKNNIEHKREYKIPQVNERYEFDFYIPSCNLLIEFHGDQHYRFVEYFHKTEDRFKHQLFRDAHKRELAKAWGYRYLEIKYAAFSQLSEETFEKRLMKYINLIK